MKVIPIGRAYKYALFAGGRAAGGPSPRPLAPAASGEAVPAAVSCAAAGRAVNGEEGVRSPTSAVRGQHLPAGAPAAAPLKPAAAAPAR